MTEPRGDADGRPGTLSQLRLGDAGAIDPATWFLGPRAENEEGFAELVARVVAHHAETRRAFHPDDPPFVSETDKTRPSYVKGMQLLGQRLEDLLASLRGSVPLASYRNQSHMYWDLTMPSLLGYLAGMLFNQNNVAAEASPVTTHLEIEVARDLCRMLGFDAEGGPEPWGHITCDGSVANGEAMWAARNTKFLPVSLFHAIRDDEALAAARDLSVLRADGRRARLLDLDTWELLNLPVDEALGLPARVLETTDVPGPALSAALDRLGVQALGLAGFAARFLAGRDCGAPVVIAPATAHYSWPKTASLIGLGSAAVQSVPVDDDGRMDLRALRRILDRCLDTRAPVVQLVAVAGTTEESAVDPLEEILAIRDEYRQMGMEFPIHADAAWGGYFTSLLREPGPQVPQSFLEPPDGVDYLLNRDPAFSLSDHVRRQVRAIARADSVTLDPHKSGFCPYPAGSLCYRNRAMRDMVAFTAPVVFHDGKDPSVGSYGIEGSKPGAAPAGVFLSHSLIPADRSGYGRLLGRCIFANKRFHAALVSLPEPGDDFRVTVLQRLPSERAGLPPADIEAEVAVIRREIASLENRPLLDKLDDPGNEALRALFRALGGDLSILTYAFNFRTGAGWNRDQALMNELNLLIFDQLSVSRYNGGRVPDVDLIVTSSSFDPATYGQPFVDGFARRAGIEPEPGRSLDFLISTTQNPWITETRHPGGDPDERHNFIPELMNALRRAVTKASAEVIRRNDLPPPDQETTHVPHGAP